MKYKISGRKAGVPIDEFIAFVVFILVAFFAIFLMSNVSRTSENEIRDNIALQKASNDAHTNLMLFLKQQNNDVNMQEIIANSYYKNDYSQVTQSITSYFNLKYSGNWAIVIRDSGNRNVLTVNPHNILGPSPTAGVAVIRKDIATAYIPLNPSAQSSYLEIKLWHVVSQTVYGK